MNRDELKRQAKATALSSLQTLSAAFADDPATTSSIARMLDTVNEFDVKPTVAAPAVGFMVIGDAVAVPQQQSGDGGGPSEPEGKRARRAPAEQADQRTLDNFPIGCEVLLPRSDENQRYNSYCSVVGHTADGKLRLKILDPSEDEDQYVNRSISMLGVGLGSEESRPLVRSSTGQGSSSEGSPSPSAQTAAGRSSGASSSTAVAPAPATAIDAPKLEESLVQPPVEDERSAKEQLAASSLRISEGRTREQLNQHLAALKLSAKFGQTVVSAREKVVSHLTFNIGAWNNLPPDESTPYVWWLGTGEKRLPLANQINPEHHPQSPNGVHLFFAFKRSSGGALCHYGGHYRTRNFVVLPEVLEFKGEKRQARIELQFCHFDGALCAAVNVIPENN